MIYIIVFVWWTRCEQANKMDENSAVNWNKSILNVFRIQKNNNNQIKGARVVWWHLMDY